MGIFCVIRSLCSFITPSQSLSHLSLLPSHIYLLALSLIQTSLQLVMLFLIIATIISKPGTFRNKRRPQDSNFAGQGGAPC